MSNLKKQIIDTLFNNMKHKLEEDKSVLLNFEVYNDLTLHNIQRYGVYVIGIAKFANGKTYAVATDYDWSYNETNNEFTTQEIIDELKIRLTHIQG